MTSPFAAYANAVLRFPVTSGTLDVDPATGNVKPGQAFVSVTALLSQKSRPTQQEIPGVDTSAVYLEGYAVEPMLLPSVVTPNSLCQATWDGKAGKFYLLLQGRSPYGVAPITGDRLKGYFQVAEYIVDGTPWTPDPDPSPNPTPSGSGIKVAFAFGDATPKAIVDLLAGATVFTAQIVIQTPFNGVGAALRLGDSGVSDRLISASQVDPTFVAEYETNPGYTYSAATQILLSITPGEGCTQGAGYILLEAA